MTASCPACYGLARDGLLCGICTRNLTTDLRGNDAVMGVAELVDNLHVAQAKLARIGGGSDSRKGDTKHERLALGVGAMEACRHLEAILGSWAMDVTGETWWPVQGRYVAVSAAEQLLDEIDAIRAHGAVNDLMDEVRKAIHRARDVVDLPERFSRFPVGPCPEIADNGQPCERTVFALVPGEESTQPALMACYRMVLDERRPDLGAGFAHTWQTHQWLRAGRRILDVMEKRKRAAA
jgi:hypothetical protein